MAGGRFIRGGICAIAVALLSAGPAQAVTFYRLNQSSEWSGSLSNTAAPAPGACTSVTCHSYDVNLRLPHGAFHRPGGMLVSLKWPDSQLDLAYDLDLYVYAPNGKLAARSNNVIYSSAEGAWLQNPHNGRYRVVVAGRDVVGTSPYMVHVDFKRGWTVHTHETNQLADPGPGVLPYTSDFVFLGQRPRRPRLLLPDVEPSKPANFHIETAAGGTFYQSFDRGLRHPPSCYPQETTGADADQPGSQPNHPTRCLRFDQGLRNIGRGPLEIRAYPNNGNGTDAWQVVYRSDGTYAERKAGRAEFSTAHGHIHYHGFEETGLYTIGRHGRPGKLVVQMADKGRCAVDTTDPEFGQPGNGPAHYFVPSTCDTNDNQDPTDPVYPNASYFRSAISPGWQDTYPWFILDSYIDISNVPDGRYLIVDRVNGSGVVRERTRANNTSIACVEFHGTTVSGCPVVRSR